MVNPPLGTVVILVLALAALSWARTPSTPDRPRVSFFREFLPLGRERFPELPTAQDSLHSANGWLVINNNGLSIIKKSEGLRIDAYYLAGQWLIGYGHAGTAEKGMMITADDAERLLISDVRDAEDAVRNLVGVPLNENEFSALVSLAYNTGRQGFAETELLRRLNSGDKKGAADEFRHIIWATVDGERVALDALKRRRAAERALFLSPPLRS